MSKEVYSWRVSAELKSDLEREARLRGVSVSSLLDTAVRELLTKSSRNSGEDDRQRQLHAAAEACFGIIAGGNPRRSESVTKLVRSHLRRRQGR